ncbi:hypothetical protein OKW35_006884 [Paraburkholderia sp. MM5477-R1]|jgi:hypothetical protein
MPNVAVTYKYSGKGQKTMTAQTTKTFRCSGQTESAVMSELRRLQPNANEIVILKIEWK